MMIVGGGMGAKDRDETASGARKRPHSTTVHCSSFKLLHLLTHSLTHCDITTLSPLLPLCSLPVQPSPSSLSLLLPCPSPDRQTVTILWLLKSYRTSSCGAYTPGSTPSRCPAPRGTWPGTSATAACSPRWCQPTSPMWWSCTTTAQPVTRNKRSIISRL